MFGRYILTVGFLRKKIVFGRFSSTEFKLKDRFGRYSLTLYVHPKLKDRVGRCSLALFKLKDRVWTIQFNFRCSSKLKDRVGRCSLALFKLKDRVGRCSLTWCICLS